MQTYQQAAVFHGLQLSYTGLIHRAHGCLRLSLRAILVLTLLATLHPALADDSCLALHIDETATVKNVIDGDTVRLANNRLLRLIGINTPEIDHEHNHSEPYAQEARETLMKLIGPQRRIEIQYGREREDRHGRLLGHVFSREGINIQQRMLEEGLAFWIAIPPNLNSMQCYHDAEWKARAQSSGIWGEKYFSAKTIASLDQGTRGFAVVTGIIQRVGQGRKNIWLNLADTDPAQSTQQVTHSGKLKFTRMALRIKRTDLHYFQDLIKDEVNDLSNWQGKRITARGWIYADVHSKQQPPQLVMQVKHPAALEFIPVH